jgi:hypothetical protein
MKSRLTSILLLAACSDSRHFVEIPQLPTSHEQQSLQTTSPQRISKVVPSAPRDPYEGWDRWCEGPTTPCSRDADCAPDRTGRARKCIRPWWSKDERVCAIPFAARGEVAATKAKVRRIVDGQCGSGCNAEKLWKFVSIVAARESSWRTWKQHRLDPDVRAAKHTWSKYAALYADNPHRAARQRWQGWGLLGQQSPTFAMLWDVDGAPPEVLCRPVVAVATYLSMARRAWRKQADLGIAPTWNTVHAAVSLGKVRPTEDALAGFRRQAERVGLDPDERIGLRQLGQVLGASPEARNATAALLDADLLVASRRG